MNILSLVFSILLIFSFSFYACFEKGRGTRDIQKAFTSQASVRRSLFRTYANELYKGVQGMKKLSSDAPSKPSSPKEKLGQKKTKDPFKISLECSKMNLYPLVEKGKEQNLVLHQTVIHFLRLFYEKPLFGFFSKKEKFVEEFLDEWLTSLQKILLKEPKNPVNLEQIVFKDPALQTLYYNMLRGAKNKYPSLLDFVKVQPRTKKEEKICLKHASPDLLRVFFGEAANELFQEIHSDINALPMERIEELCRAHRHPLSYESLELLNLILANHRLGSELTLLEEESGGAISLRKKTYRK